MTKPKRRLVLTQGGKSGTGKTTLLTAPVDWYDARQFPYSLVDLDTEASKSRGSLIHSFQVRRRRSTQPARRSRRSAERVARWPARCGGRYGAGAGQVAHKWFDDMYDGAKELGVAFTAIELVTPDPATVDSVVKWANALQDRTDYLIVKKAVNNPSDFGGWDGAELAEKFRNKLSPKVIEMEFHMPSVEFAA